MSRVATAGVMQRRPGDGARRAAALAGLGIAAIVLGVLVARKPSLYCGLAYVCAVPILAVIPLRRLPAVALTVFALVPIHWFPVPNVYKTLTPSAVVVVVWAIRALVQPAHRGPRTVRVALGLLAALILVGAAKVGLHNATVTWTVDFLVLVIAPALIVATRGRIEARDIIRPWMLLAAWLSVLAVVEALLLKANPLYDWAYHAQSDTTAPITQVWSVYRATTTLGHPLVNGVFFAVGAALALGEYLRERRPASLALALTASAGVIASGSRSAIGGLLAGALLVAFAASDASARGGRVGRIAAAFGATVLIAAVALGSSVGDRLSSSEGSGSAQTRGQRLSVGLTIVRTHPLTGVGPGLAGAAAAAALDDNGGVFEDAWLELAIAVGIPAVALLLVAVVAAIRRAARHVPAAAAGLAAYVVIAGAFNLWEGDRPALILFGLLFAAALARPGPDGGDAGAASEA